MFVALERRSCSENVIAIPGRKPKLLVSTMAESILGPEVSASIVSVATLLVTLLRLLVTTTL